MVIDIHIDGDENVDEVEDRHDRDADLDRV